MNETHRADLYGAPVRVTSQPAATPALLRPQWRVPIVALIVGACRQAKAKREQIVLLNWALRDSATHAVLVAALSGERPRHPAFVRYEPAMVRATNIAHGVGVLERQGDWLSLTTAGDGLRGLLAEEGLYARERERIDDLPKPLPFNLAVRLLRGSY